MNQLNVAHDLAEKMRTKDVILAEEVNFDCLLLPDAIRKGLSACGFRKPSPIQFKAIPLGRCGFDLVVKSKAGTGKTLVFSVIALETVNIAKDQPQVLILAPTREIAVQIDGVLKSIGSSITGLKVESFIGGLPVGDDVKKIKNCHVVVGAPGRIKHLITMGALSTDSIRLFVMDEADKLMETSFQSDINEIYNVLPQRKQIIASSATYPHELDLFLTNYMLSPTHVSAESETPLLLGLKQFVHVLPIENSTPVLKMKAKNEVLNEILSTVTFSQCLVFTNYQTRAESISNFLNQKKWNSTYISAAQTQSKRLEVVNNLKDFKSRILLSTDLTARGIDAPNVDLVINYDIPHNAVTYLHRMGRAGRYGSQGICINLAVEGSELVQLQNIVGTIGGNNLSIARLKENYCDIWQTDPTTLEQVCGIIPSDLDKISEEIKKEVMTFKEVNNSKTNNNQGGNAKKKKQKRCKKELRVEKQEKDQLDVDKWGFNKDKSHMEKRENSEENPDMVLDILNSARNAIDEISEKFSSVKTEDLLNSLVSGEGLVPLESNIKNETAQVENLLQLLDSDTETEDNKKRKRTSNDSAKEFHQEKRKTEMQNFTYCKNRTVFGVLQLLDNPEMKVDPELLEFTGKYLNSLKEFSEEDLSRSNNWDPAENNLSTTRNKETEIFPQTSSDNPPNLQWTPVNQANTGETINIRDDAIEDVFKIGYEYAISNNEGSWLDCLPQEELEKLEQKRITKKTASASADVEEQDEDYENYEMDDEYHQENYSDEQVSDSHCLDLKWVPVEPNNSTGPQCEDNYCGINLLQDELTVSHNMQEQSSTVPETYSEEFERHYRDCSDVLWQNGLTFETVEDLDNYFCQWQEQLTLVRNYVQQNIYVSEMNKYQQCRNGQ